LRRSNVVNDFELETSRPSERPLPAESRARIKETLMRNIREDHDDDTSSAPGGRRRRKRGLIGLAVVAVAAGTGAVAAAGGVRPRPPDRQHAPAAIKAFAQQAIAPHGPGWRPELGAESIRCAPSAAANGHEGSVTMNTASAFPITEDLTVERIRVGCNES